MSAELLKKRSFVYLLRCSDGSFYCGWTNDPERRLRTHNAGHGAKYTKSRLPVQLVYLEAFETKQEAQSREWHVKRLSHREKEILAANTEDSIKDFLIKYEI